MSEEVGVQGIDHVWEQIHSSREWGKYPSEPIIRFVARNYYESDRRSTRILDFGCGGGAHSWYLAREGFDVYAFDGAPSAVKNAKTYLEKDGLKAQFSVMDGVELAYEDEFFDAVIDSFCIYANRIDAIRRMYDNVYRVLKPGGRLFTAAFGIETLGYGHGTELEKDTFSDITDGVLVDRGVSHFWTEETLMQELDRAGFGKITLDEVRYTDTGKMVQQFFVSCVK